MVYNQDLPRYNAVDIAERFSGWKENKSIATNSVNIAKNSKTACTMDRTSFNSITHSRITEESWEPR